MSGIAGIVHWDGRPVPQGHLDPMLGAIRHRGPDGLVGEARGSVALGYARLTVRKTEQDQVQPVWLPDRSCAIVADARLYNREELLESLGGVEWIPDPPSDAAILLAAYERWGAETVHRLHGDFVFAIWDSRRRRVFAVRDPFGAKPFFFWAGGTTLRFGSEPKQLLIFPELSVEPEERVVVEHLLGRPEARELTFFKDVHRLPAAHYLVASGGGFSLHAYWEPHRQETLKLPPGEEYDGRFRALFKQAVASRLVTDWPVGAQLSGGLDSSSVVAMAMEIYNEQGSALPGFQTLSETYSGFPCDESSSIEVMSKRLPFGSRWIDCSDFDLPSSIDTELWKEDGPTPELTPDRTQRVSQSLSSLEARVLLTGYGGDELTWDPEWAPDLLRQGRLLAAIGQSWQLSRLPAEDGFPSVLRRAIVQSIPQSLKGPLFAARPRRAVEWPAHLNPELCRYFEEVEKPVESRGAFLSIAQKTVHRWLTNPLLHWNLERLEQRYAAHGKELRHPFFDRRLAELVLAIPPVQRVASSDRRKALLQAAMEGLLPPEITEQRGSVVFDTYFLAAWRQWRPILRRVIHSSDRWFSEPYTDRASVLSWLDPAAANATMSMRELSQAWAALGLELWLRGLGRYSAAEYDEASHSLGDVDHV